jgi:hypothetical protein
VRNPFAETGAANSFLANFEDFGMGFQGSESQLTMTPLQRQIIDAERTRRAEAQQERREEMMEGNGGGQQQQPQRQRNSRAGGGGNSNRQSETVRYINKSENPDYEFD